MADEQQRHQETSSSPQRSQALPPKDQKSIHDLRNQDYVSRLLAATPPYLYSAPVGPNNFFFSDMLRSLVQTRNNENARNLQMQQAAVMARRPRKRSWSQHRPYYEHLRERKHVEDKAPTAEKPLELTNKQFISMDAVKYSKSETTVKESQCHKSSSDAGLTENQKAIQESTTVASLPPQDLVLPPPPPVWYPPVYPPYGIDPLHFFIDLRVSGHIYDRKKENLSPLTNTENNTLTLSESDTLGKFRQGSAFTVPVPRSDSKGSTAINLSSSTSSSLTEATSKLESYAKYYDLGETKENDPNPRSNRNYVLQNLPRFYSQFSGTKDLADDNTYENDSKSDQECEESTDDNGCAVYRENSAHIDVEMVESVKLHNDDGESSRQTSPDECNLTQHSD